MCAKVTVKADSIYKCGEKKYCTVGKACVTEDECEEADKEVEFLNNAAKALGKDKKKIKFSCCKGNLCNGSISLNQNFAFYVFISAFLMFMF